MSSEVFPPTSLPRRPSLSFYAWPGERGWKGKLADRALGTAFIPRALNRRGSHDSPKAIADHFETVPIHWILRGLSLGDVGILM